LTTIDFLITGLQVELLLELVQLGLTFRCLTVVQLLDVFLGFFFRGFFLIITSVFCFFGLRKISTLELLPTDFSL